MGSRNIQETIEGKRRVMLLWIVKEYCIFDEHVFLMYNNDKRGDPFGQK